MEYQSLFSGKNKKNINLTFAAITKLKYDMSSNCCMSSLIWVYIVYSYIYVQKYSLNTFLFADIEDSSGCVYWWTW